jgi:DNA polymerase
MIKAMKLTAAEVVIYPVSIGDNDLSAEVMAITSFFQPEVVITLGAIASNKILKNNDRLSNTHGQFFTRKINSSVNFTVVPLFHPTIIESNQNMKKTAWADMQKIMKVLKKLP